MSRSHGDKSKINACTIKENPGNWIKGGTTFNGIDMDSNDFMEYQLDGYEAALSTRLSDETFRGIINFQRATIPGTPIDEIEKALVS